MSTPTPPNQQTDPISLHPPGSVTGWAVKWKDAFGMRHTTEWAAVSLAEMHTGQLLSLGAEEVIINTVKSPNAPDQRPGEQPKP